MQVSQLGKRSDEQREFSFMSQFYHVYDLDEVIEGDIKRPFPYSDYHSFFTKKKNFNYPFKQVHQLSG